MAAPMQCYTTFSRAFKPQVLLTSSNRKLTMQAASFARTRSLAGSLSQSGCAACRVSGHHCTVHSKALSSAPTRTYATATLSKSSLGAHPRGCACSTCRVTHRQGCGCNTCRPLSTLLVRPTSLAHGRGCACSACRISLQHDKGCDCSPCRSFSVAAFSHETDCACSSCATSSHQPGCSCPPCQSLGSIGTPHAKGCSCLSCGPMGQHGNSCDCASCM